MNSTNYKVRISRKAAGDLLELAVFIRRQDGPEESARMHALLRERIKGLHAMPSRGRLTPEHHGKRPEIREILEGPWRIGYHIAQSEVVVIYILDARRDAREHLEARVLRP